MSQSKIDNFQDEFDKRSKHAEDLAEKRSQDLKIWLVSECLLNALDYYDQTSNVQGVKFSLQVNACLFGVSSSPELKAILDDWWATEEIKRDNLCWRTYLYNNNITIDDVNQYIQLQDSITIDDDPSKHDLIGKTSTIIDLLDKITGHLDATHTAADAWARSGLPIAFLSISLSDLLRRFLQTVNIGVAQTLHNRLGNLILTHISHEARTLYHLGFNINGSSFSANPSRAAPQIVNVARQNYQNADLVNSRIAMIALIFNGLPMLLKLFRDKPLDEREKTELVASAIGMIAAGFQVGLSYVEATIGNQSNSRTAIVVSNGFGRLFLWAASLSSIAGSMSAVFDVIDMKKEFDKDNSIVAMGYLVRAVATLTLSVSQFLVAMGTINPWLTRILATSTRRTVWTRIVAFGAWLGRIALTQGVAAVLAVINVYATLIIIVVSVVIMIFDDNALQKWFDRCCFSKQTDRDAFDDLTEELTEFHIAIKECF